MICCTNQSAVHNSDYSTTAPQPPGIYAEDPYAEQRANLNAEFSERYGINIDTGATMQAAPEPPAPEETQENPIDRAGAWNDLHKQAGDIGKGLVEPLKAKKEQEEAAELESSMNEAHGAKMEPEVKEFKMAETPSQNGTLGQDIAPSASAPQGKPSQGVMGQSIKPADHGATTPAVDSSGVEQTERAEGISNNDLTM